MVVMGEHHMTHTQLISKAMHSSQLMVRKQQPIRDNNHLQLLHLQDMEDMNKLLPMDSSMVKRLLQLGMAEPLLVMMLLLLMNSPAGVDMVPQGMIKGVEVDMVAVVEVDMVVLQEAEVVMAEMLLPKHVADLEEEVVSVVALMALEIMDLLIWKIKL